MTNVITLIATRGLHLPVIVMEVSNQQWFLYPESGKSYVFGLILGRTNWGVASSKSQTVFYEAGIQEKDNRIPQSCDIRKH